MKKELSAADLEKVTQSGDIDAISLPEIASLFRSEAGLADYAPDGVCRTDPRDGSKIIYNASRARRPHDNRPDDVERTLPPKACPICEGKTTGVLDVAPLSEGFTFINKNLFPCVFPFARQADDGCPPLGRGEGTTTRGLHFLQWTSTRHDQDWHNMGSADLIIVLERLGRLEQHLLETDDEWMPLTSEWHRDGRPRRGFVSIIKNVGAAVGGSLTHGHQQIVYSNTMPAQTFNNWRFEKDRGISFSEHLQQSSSADLIVADLGSAVALVPYFMKRPYAAMIALKDVEKPYLHTLTQEELSALAAGWSGLAAAYMNLMPALGREPAYNVLVHTGPGAGLYLEFLPFTQETGGYEQLGLWVCQGEPSAAAAVLRSAF